MRPKDLIKSFGPNKYEVIKLITGESIVGITTGETDDKVDVIVPMICQLNIVQSKETMATFIPYQPLSSDSIISFPHDTIVQRSHVNEQFIEIYDAAASQWVQMCEEKTIPLISAEERKKVFNKFIDDKLQVLRKEIGLSDFDDDYVDDDLPTDKDIIH